MNQFEIQPKSEHDQQPQHIPSDVDFDEIFAKAKPPTPEQLIASAEARIRMEGSADMHDRVAKRADRPGQ